MLQGCERNGRGGDKFGPNITQHFLEHNKLDLIVRSHELCMQGYAVSHNNRLITIFSAPNYCEYYSNQGAVMIVDSYKVDDVAVVAGDDKKDDKKERLHINIVPFGPSHYRTH